MFTKYGDVTVVKTAKAQYWVEFESLDVSKQFNSIGKVATFFKKKEKAVSDIKMFDEATRFKSDQV